jgi:hypothetical protein
VGLSPDAAALDLAFAEHIEAQCGPDGRLRGIAGWASKLAGDMRRVTLGLHCVTRSSVDAAVATPVPRKTVADAIRLAQYAIPHALAAHGLMHGKDAEAGALAILRWLQRSAPRATVSERDVYRAMPGAFNSTTVRPPLAVLVERAYLRPAAGTGAGAGGGRPHSARYEINPAVYEPAHGPDGGHDQFCQALSMLCQSPEDPAPAPAGPDLSVDQDPKEHSASFVNSVKPFGGLEDEEDPWEVRRPEPLDHGTVVERAEQQRLPGTAHSQSEAEPEGAEDEWTEYRV